MQLGYLSKGVAVGAFVAVLAGVLVQWPQTRQQYLNFLVQPSKQSSAFQARSESTHQKQHNEHGQEIVNGTERHISFENNIDEEVTLYWWHPTDNEETEITRIQPGNHFKSSTFIDHIWVFRNTSTGELLRSIAISETSANSVEVNQTVAEQFKRQYSEENGIEWENIVPRKPCSHHFYGGENVGDIEILPTKFAQWKSDEDSLHDLASDTFDLKIETLSLSPKIVKLPNFLSPEECDHLIERGNNTLGGFKRSRVGSVYATSNMSESRTSSNTWVDYKASELVEHITKRIFDVMKIPYEINNARKISETFQLLHYAVNQEYKAHLDWFPFDSEDTAHYLEVLRGHNRFATFFLYLSDVEEGGETAFGEAEGHQSDDPCNKGFRVKPKKGNAVIFYSMLPDGNLDKRSKHHACPVIKGEKYAANIWFWEPTRFKLSEDNNQ